MIKKNKYTNENRQEKTKKDNFFLYYLFKVRDFGP